MWVLDTDRFGPLLITTDSVGGNACCDRRTEVARNPAAIRDRIGCPAAHQTRLRPRKRDFPEPTPRRIQSRSAASNLGICLRILHFPFDEVLCPNAQQKRRRGAQWQRASCTMRPRCAAMRSGF